MATDAGWELCAQAQQSSRDVVARIFATVDPVLRDAIRAALADVVFAEVEESVS